MYQLFIFVLYTLLVQSDGVINKLNTTEYYKMPPLYFLDDYDICMVSPEATYCVVDFNLEAGINRELMRTIQAYDDPLKQLLFNATLVTQTFFVMSSVLLAYNFMLYTETHTINWMHLPKGILLRWLRLTPTYALVLATIMTWMRHLHRGPLWPLVVTSEAVACRQYWWAQLLFINNYVYDDAYCMPQTWYLAADTQLFCIGLLVCILARTNKARVVILTTLMILALVVVAGHTYLQDLNAIFIQSPESFRNIFATDAYFKLMYVRGHTNMTSAVTGLATGFVAYHWQNNKNLDTFKKYRWLMWLAFPLGVATILSGGVFYTDGGRAPMLWRVLYGTFYKPLFQFLLITVIFGCMFKFESVYRGILEWRGFTWTGRVTYGAFLLHTLFQRGLVGVQRQPIYITDYYVAVILSATVLITYIGAVVLWLFVEAPGAALIRAAFTKIDTTTKDTTRKLE